MTDRVEAAFLIIGNEILSGRTQDANLAWLAAKLNDAGIILAEARIIRDIEAEIVNAVQALSARYAYVFTSGGIGPTHDDITAASIAVAFDTPLERHADAYARLAEHYADPEALTEARLKMADIPLGASLIDNPVSAAPGFKIGNVHVLAGVPKIFQAMVDGILPSLVGGVPVLSKTVASNLPESEVADLLGAVEAANPGVEIGSYPYFNLKLGKAGVSVVLRATDQAKLDVAAEAVFEGIKGKGGIPTYLAAGIKPLA